MEQVHFEALYPDNTRFKDIEKLAGFVENGKSCQLLSIPGAGRTMILNLLANNKKIRKKHFKKYEQTHFVLVSFPEVRNKPLSDVTKFIFLSVCGSLRARRLDEYKKVNELFRQALILKDELVLFQALKEALEYLSLEKKLNIVFLFDRFEEYVPTVTDEFFGNLRALRARAKYQFSIIFSLNRPLEDMLEPSLLTDFYEFVAGNHVYLSLKDNATADFRLSYIEKLTGKKFPPSIIDGVMKETGGLGKLIKLSAEAILSRPSAVEVQDVGKFLFSQKTIQNALVDICRSLTPSEQRVLIQKDFTDKESVEYLECVGILADNKIQISLFEQHIRSHANQPSSLQKIVFDENTNTIKRGDVIISDQLTSSEFKLLIFLIQNADRIVDRDGIINVVWSDVKSTAGITDQAVDQLIFRLRRKIEEEPNKPAHLLTVKGRGFRFVP